MLDLSQSKYDTNYDNLNKARVNANQTIRVRQGFDTAIKTINEFLAIERDCIQFLQKRVNIYPRCLFAKQHTAELEGDMAQLKTTRARYQECRDEVLVVNSTEGEDVRDVQVMDLVMPLDLPPVNSDELGAALFGVSR